MTMRIAILAACAATLALAATTGTFAQSSNESPARLTDVGGEPAIVLAQNMRNVSGNNTWSGRISRSRAAPKAGKKTVWVPAGDYDGDGRGRFRTRGRYSSATVRGVRLQRPSSVAKTTRRSGTLRLEAVGRSLK